MAPFKFTRSILEGTTIEVYAAGKVIRDFTYVDDVVEAICRLCEHVPTRADRAGGATPAGPSRAPYCVVNVGGGRPVGLEQFIATIEAAVGRKAVRRDLPMQPGDVPATFASTALLEELTGFRPKVELAEGVAAFVAWYRDYFRV
jgi:UDP-glucuronate 4-epimerase